MNDEAGELSTQVSQSVEMEVTEELGNVPEFNVLNIEIGSAALDIITKMEPLATQLFNANKLSSEAQQALFAQVDRFLEAARPQLAQIVEENERGPIASSIDMLTELLAVARANAEAANAASEAEPESSQVEDEVLKPKNPLRWLRGLFVKEKR